MKELSNYINEKLDINKVNLENIPKKLDDIVTLFLKEHDCHKNNIKNEFNSENFEMWYYKEFKLLYLRGNPKKWIDFLKEQPKSIAEWFKHALATHVYNNRDVIYQVDLSKLLDEFNNKQAYNFLNNIYDSVK